MQIGAMQCTFPKFPDLRGFVLSVLQNFNMMISLFLQRISSLKVLF